MTHGQKVQHILISGQLWAVNENAGGVKTNSLQQKVCSNLPNSEAVDNQPGPCKLHD